MMQFRRFLTYWGTLSFKRKLIVIFFLVSTGTGIITTIEHLFTWKGKEQITKNIIFNEISESSIYYLSEGRRTKLDVPQQGVLGLFYPCMRKLRFTGHNTVHSEAAQKNKHTDSYDLVIDNRYKVKLIVSAYEAYKFSVHSLHSDNFVSNIYAINCELTLLNQSNK